MKLDHYQFVLRSLLDYSKLYILDNCCPITLAAYLDILNSSLCQISKAKCDDGSEVDSLIKEWADFLLHQISTYDFRSPVLSSSLCSSTCIALLLCIRFLNENSKSVYNISFDESLKVILVNIIQRDPSTFSLLCEEILSLVPTLIPKELQILKSVLLTHSLDQMKAFR